MFVLNAGDTTTRYALVAQGEAASEFPLDDESAGTSSEPQPVGDDNSPGCRGGSFVVSHCTCLTVSLCLLCSLLTLVATLYGTLAHHALVVEWLNDVLPQTMHGQWQFTLRSANMTSLSHDATPGSALPTSFTPSTSQPFTPVRESFHTYYALSSAPVNSSHPPFHTSTLYNATAPSLPSYITSTFIDHTQTRQAFHVIDEAIAAAGRWPGRVDLMVRTTVFSVTILPLMFQSIELFWPRNVGRCIVVADESHVDRWQMRFNLPEWCELHYETVLPEMIGKGRWAMQWHDFWGDNFTRADYVAVMDTDSYFTYKITPDVLFDAQGRVLMSIDHTFQRGMYDTDTQWWLGDGSKASAAATSNMSHLVQHYPINFMQNLPIVMPTALYPAFRQYVVDHHAADADAAATGHHFDGINKLFMQLHYHDPSQFCILGNYWLYFSPPHLRSQLHIVLTDHSTLDIDRQQLGLPLANGDPMEKVYQIFMKATVHVPHNSYYRGHPSVIKRHPEDKIDPPSLYTFSQQQFHTALCEAQKYWLHIDRAIWSMLCNRVTDDDRALHMDLSMLYCYVESSWHMNRHRRDLTTPHAYQAKWAWMGEIVNAAYQNGLQAAIDVVRRYPTHVEWDREQQRLQREADLLLEAQKLNSTLPTVA